MGSDSAKRRGFLTLEQLWVAETENGIAGVAALTMDQEPEYAQANWDMRAKALVVHRLAVDPAFRGAGVASALMQKAEEVAVEREFAVVRVDTNTENAATQRLFRNTSPSTRRSQRSFSRA